MQPYQDRDTFYTVKYRDSHIHGCFNRTTGREEFKVQLPDNRIIPQNTFLGAKRFISRRVVSLTTEPTQFAKL